MVFDTTRGGCVCHVRYHLSRVLSCLCLAACCLAPTDLRAQPEARPDPIVPKLQSVIPPSPTAASLGKYADWPVSLFTGLPTINVPLYEVKSGVLSVPISLSYHASGHKVGDIASWVGLGWSLNAGGVITRSVRGLPDDHPDLGYFHIRESYPNKYDLLSSSTPLNFLNDQKVQSAAGTIDTEPDIFMLNAAGMSFKLLLYPDGSISTVPHSNTKIVVNWTEKSWTVTMEDGTQLLFGTQDGLEITTPPNIDAYISTWYLKRMTSVTGDVIDFTYKLPIATPSTAGFSEVDYKWTIVPGPECRNCDEEKRDASLLSGQSSQVRYLEAIESDYLKVEFVTDPEARIDLAYGKRLGMIVVKRKPGDEVLLTFKFEYVYSEALYTPHAYYSTSETRQRLRLIGVSRRDQHANEFDRWSFGYNPEKLPERYSYAQDYWGYYNGKSSNETLLPLLIGSNNRPIFELPRYKSANRETDPSTIQAEMLTEITFPTGGSTTYEYDANYIQEEGEAFEPDIKELSLIATHSNHSTFTADTTLVITKPQYISLYINGSFSAGYLGDHTGLLASAGLYNLTTETSEGIVSVSGNEEKTATFFLAPGNYIFTLTLPNASVNDFDDPSADARAEARFTYQKSIGQQTVKKYVGGLRVKRIRIKDNISEIETIRRFDYDKAFVISTFSNESFLTSISEEVRRLMVDLNGYYCYYDGVCTQLFTSRHSSTQEALGSIQGGTVGYGKVTTFYGEDGEGGRSVSQFSTHADENSEISRSFPFPAACSFDWRRGLLLSQIEFNSVGERIQRVAHTYSFEPRPILIGFKAGAIIQRHHLAQVHQDIRYGEVRMVGEQMKHDTKRVTTYAVRNGVLDSMVHEETYYYDNALNTKPVRTEFVNSSGQLVRRIEKGALEASDITNMSSNTATAVSSMVAKNIVSSVIEQEETIDGMLNYKKRTNYIIDPATNIIVPENIYLQTGTSLFEERVKFSRYGIRGTLLEQSKTNDVKSTYLWGYDHSFVIAEIKNATYQSVVDVLGQTAINALNSDPGSDAEVRSVIQQLRSAPSMTAAQITSYTYDPAFGVTSITDPNNLTTFYEYDSIGRLKLIRDHNNNVLKTYEYNFQVR